MSALLGKVAHLVWFLFTWFFLVGVVCAAFFAFALYHRVDEKIRSDVEQLLANHYPEFDVRIGHARLVEREGFRLKDVSLKERVPGAVGREIVHVEEVVVKCRPLWKDLMIGQIELAEVVIRQPSIRSTRLPDGSWNMRDLLRLPKLAGRAPPMIRLEDGSLEVVDLGRQPTGFFVVRDIRGWLHAQPTEGEPAVDQSEYQLEVSFTGDHLQRTSVRGVFSPHQKSWRVTGQISDMIISPELQAALPGELGQQFESLGELRARCSVTFDVAHDPSQAVGIVYSAQGSISEGKLTDPCLSMPLTELAATFELSNHVVRVENVSGRLGEALVRFQWHREGSLHNAPTIIRGAADRVRLDQHWFADMPEPWQQWWATVQPRGLASVDFEISNVHGDWVSDVQIRCHDVSLLWDAFPYPVESVAGDVRLRDDQVEFDLKSQISRQPLRIRGEIHQPGSEWFGWFETKTLEPMRLDDRLISALPAHVQSVLRDFSLHTLVAFQCRHTRNEGDLDTQRELSVDVSRGTMQYVGFPYPLTNVNARISLRDGKWFFHDFVGTNDGGRVTGCGEYWPAHGNVLRLRCIATDVPLEAELRDALPAAAQQIWRSLGPEGVMDQVIADWSWSPGSPHPDLRLQLTKHQVNENEPGTNVSLRMRAMPLRIDSVTGGLRYDNGCIQLHKLRGKYDGIELAADGTGNVAADGSWDLTLDRLVVDRIRLKPEIVQALPTPLKKLIHRSQLQGAISLDGHLALSGTPEAEGNHHAAWQLLLDVDEGAANLGGRCEHVAGQLRLDGYTRESQFGCRGQFDLDSMLVDGVHMTNIRGPLWIDDHCFITGAWTNPANDHEPPQPVQANVLGGKMLANFYMENTDEGNFHAHFQLHDGDVRRMANLLLRPEVAVRGRGWAEMTLRGTRQGKHTYQGQGSVSLRDTNLYELPIFLALLKTMSTGMTDRTAFTASDATFRLQGTHLYFDQLDLIGDTLTLKGVGEMGLDRKLNLDFYSVLGREDAYLPLIRPVLGLASRRFLLVKVSGTVDSPHMSREVLPGLNDTLKRLFPDEASGAEADSRSTQVSLTSAETVRKANTP